MDFYDIWCWCLLTFLLSLVSICIYVHYKIVKQIHYCLWKVDVVHPVDRQSLLASSHFYVNAMTCQEFSMDFYETLHEWSPPEYLPWDWSLSNFRRCLAAQQTLLVSVNYSQLTHKALVTTFDVPIRHRFSQQLSALNQAPANVPGQAYFWYFLRNKCLSVNQKMCFNTG